MANMSYCMFENTTQDLRQIWNDDEYRIWNPEDLSESERRYRRALIRLCNEIAEEFPMDEEEDWS